MAREIEYNDENLQRMFTELDQTHRIKVFKGAFRKEANKVRKVAIRNLHSVINADKDIDTGIRSIVFREKAGFRVTIGTKQANRNGKGARGYYVSRKHRDKRGANGELEDKGKPVLIWAEEGTGPRRTKGRITMRFWTSRKKHSTGRMKAYGFMQKTLGEVKETVTSNLHQEITKRVIRVAKKYGCK